MARHFTIQDSVVPGKRVWSVFESDCGSGHCSHGHIDDANIKVLKAGNVVMDERLGYDEFLQMAKESGLVAA